MTLGEVAGHLRELAREPSSHYFADLAGWDFPLGLDGIATIIHAEGWLESHRDEKKNPRPVSLPKPWRDKGTATVVTDEERKAYARRLAQRSAFRGDR